MPDFQSKYIRHGPGDKADTEELFWGGPDTIIIPLYRWIKQLSITEINVNYQIQPGRNQASSFQMGRIAIPHFSLDFL
jgi:hypothetical protein